MLDGFFQSHANATRARAAEEWPPYCNSFDATAISPSLAVAGASRHSVIPSFPNNVNAQHSNPAGRLHYFRTDSVTDAKFMLLVGTSNGEDIRFQPA